MVILPQRNQFHPCAYDGVVSDQKNQNALSASGVRQDVCRSIVLGLIGICHLCLLKRTCTFGPVSPISLSDEKRLVSSERFNVRALQVLGSWITRRFELAERTHKQLSVRLVQAA